jgi:hypothetical protein
MPMNHITARDEPCYADGTALGLQDGIQIGTATLEGMPNGSTDARLRNLQKCMGI